MSEKRAYLHGTRLHVWCPACGERHVVTAAEKQTPVAWAWNGSLERPTLAPSLMVSWGKAAKTPDGREKKCHSYVEDGRIRFLADSTHALAGREVDLPPWPYPEKEDAS